VSEVFISYARPDRPMAERVANALERRHRSVWWDREIPPGRTFDEVIEEALEAARCVVVLWSTTSVGSDWVKIEAAEGARRKILIPALIEAVAPPLEFRRIQAADLHDWQDSGPHGGFDRFLKSVEMKLGDTVAEPIAPSPAKPSDPRPSSTASTAWHAGLISTAWVKRSLRVVLTHETHVVEVAVNFLKLATIVRVDGVVAVEVPLEEGLMRCEFELQDGPDRHAAQIEIKRSFLTEQITQCRLSLGEQVLYRE